MRAIRVVAVCVLWYGNGIRVIAAGDPRLSTVGTVYRLGKTIHQVCDSCTEVMYIIFPKLISNEFHTMRCFPALHCSLLGAELPGNSRIVCIDSNIGRPWNWFHGHPFLNGNGSIQLDHLVSFQSHVVPCANSYSYQSRQYGWDPKSHQCSPRYTRKDYCSQ